MLGQAFLVTFVATDKSDSPEGAKQKISEHAEAARHTQTRSLWARVRGNDGFEIGAQGQEPSPIPNEKMPFLPDRETAFFLEWTALPAFAEGFLATAVMPTRNRSWSGA
jgi:hypothetical protein